MSRDDYESVLREADVIVSTANHEFFGIGVLEGVSAGAYPVVPNRLSYPEVLGLGRAEAAEQFFYDGTVKDLAKNLQNLARRIQTENLWPNELSPQFLTDRFKWPNLAATYDKGLEQALHSQHHG